MLTTHGPAARTTRGVTLTELMVSVSVLAVGLAIAAPSISQQLGNYRVQQMAEGVLGGLSLARTEAVRRNTAVKFTLNTNGSGWSVDLVNPPPNIPARIQSRSTADGAGVAATPDSGHYQVVFTPTGFVDTTASPMSQVVFASNVADTVKRRIDIFGGGLVRLCDPAATAAADARSC
jgi:type IV fimbrial biogenesis protein FimT